VAGIARVRTDVRKAERLDQGDRVRVELTTGDPR
jgi:translation initiation factor IF-1